MTGAVAAASSQNNRFLKGKKIKSRLLALFCALLLVLQCLPLGTAFAASSASQAAVASSDDALFSVYTQKQGESTKTLAKSFSRSRLNVLSVGNPTPNGGYLYPIGVVVTTQYVLFDQLIAEAGVTFEQGDTLIVAEDTGSTVTSQSFSYEEVRDSKYFFPDFTGKSTYPTSGKTEVPGPGIAISWDSVHLTDTYYTAYDAYRAGLYSSYNSGNLRWFIGVSEEAYTAGNFPGTRQLLYPNYLVVVKAKSTDPDPSPSPDPDPDPSPDPTPTPDPDPSPDPTPTPDPGDPDPGDGTVTNPDGSTTTTVTDTKAGTRTQTTTFLDGTVTVRVTELASGDWTENTTGKNGVVLAKKGTSTGTSSTSIEASQAVANAGGVLAVPASSVPRASSIGLDCPAGAVLSLPLNSASSGDVVVATLANGSEQVVSKSIVADGSIAFIVPQKAASIKVERRGYRFADVHTDDWFNQQGLVDFATARGIITGIPNDNGVFEFRGNTAVSRGMFVTMLGRLEGSPSAGTASGFSDVASDAWYAGPVSWAVSAGIVQGYGDTGRFGPDDGITREQMALMMMRYAAWLGLDTSARADLSAYSDAGDLSYGAEAMRWAVAEGLISGYEGSNQLGGLNGATRAEVCAVVQRLVGVLLA